jgi:hypothetical protein
MPIIVFPQLFFKFIILEMKMKNDELIVNIVKTWNKEDGLITINLASKVAGVSQQAISQAADNQKIKAFQYGKKRYLSYKSLLNYIASRNL